MTDRYRHALQWKPGDLGAAGLLLGTLMAEGIDFRHPSGMGATTTLLLHTGRGDLLAEPGNWLVSADRGNWQVLDTCPFTTPLVTLSLPDYLTTPAVHHGAIADSARSPRAQALVARALAILAEHDEALAAFTVTGHCITEGAYVDSRTIGDRVNVILALKRVHFDAQLNPSNHPGYPALRAARLAQGERWADLFRARGWQARSADDTTPNRLSFVLAPPTPEPAHPTTP
ncbi:hypothetical protein ACFVYG_20160 [Streptomyces sp. NPDC058256]|uniref:hypothetical protein n=1 Tax=Streptomyces sp. NPDC058256 TaxID=3346408 RepID=UPI0036EBB2EC